MANNNRTNYPGGNYRPPNSDRAMHQSPLQNSGRRPPQYGYPQKRQPDTTARNIRRVQERIGNEPRQMHIPMPPPEKTYRQYPETGRRTTASAQDAATRRRAQDIQRQMGARPDPAGRVNSYSQQSAVRKNPPAERPRRPQNKDSSRWSIPEGSAVYTSKGIYYNGRTAADSNGHSSAERRRYAEAKKAEKARIKAEKKKKFKLYTKAFFTTLGVVFILCCAAVGLLYRSTFASSNDSSGSIDYTLRVGQKHYLSGGGNGYSGGIAYIDFSDFAECFGMASVGSVDSMRFIIPDSEEPDSEGTGHEEYVIFTDGVRCATVNGTDVIMEGPCRTSGLSVRVPFSFVENYLKGVVFEKNAGGTDITVSPEKEKTDDDGNIIIPEISFSVRKPDTLSHVSYPS